jgi:hypothetical protein
LITLKELLLKLDETKEIKDVIVTAMIGYYLQDNHDIEAKETIIRRLLKHLLNVYCCDKSKEFITNLINDKNMLTRIEKFEILI